MIEALIPVAVAAATGFSVLIRGLYTRVHELDQELIVLNFVLLRTMSAKSRSTSPLERVEQRMIRIENKIDKLTA